MNIKELKETLAYSCNILANEGHWDQILGHVSVRIPKQDRILMKPHSFGLEEIRPQHIIVCNLDGKKIEGKYAIFCEGLPLFDYTTALIRTPELGREVAKTLGSCRGVLMKNHGSTVVGDSIEVAALYAVFLEKAARIQLLATASGEPSWTSDEEAKAKFEQIYTPHRLGSMWDYFVRRARKARR